MQTLDTIYTFLGRAVNAATDHQSIDRLLR